MGLDLGYLYNHLTILRFALQPVQSVALEPTPVQQVNMWEKNIFRLFLLVNYFTIIHHEYHQVI